MSSPVSYYPVYLDLRGRRCVVIGGGEVAERKVGQLLECGASVIVVAPEVTRVVAAWAQDGVITWHRRRYQEGDLEGAFLAIAGTDDSSVNAEVAEEARERKVLLNAVDDPARCDFIAPAVVRRGPVSVAIVTSGVSPALARRLRERMQDSGLCRCLAWADAADVLQEARMDLRQRGISVSPDWWQACMTDDILALVEVGRKQEAKERLLEALERGAGSWEGRS